MITHDALTHPMDEEQFFARLATQRTRLRWYVTDTRMIRGVDMHDGMYCPITAVCEAPPDTLGAWDRHATKAQLSCGIAMALLEAIDHDSGHDAALRARLLVTLGLADEVTP